MAEMRALVKEGARLSVREMPRPVLNAADEVIIRVIMAGICRTDLYVAQGHIDCRDPLIPGHEFSGVVSEKGRAVQEIEPGDRVTVMPIIPCHDCALCWSGSGENCTHSTMLGIDRHGAFAEFVVVPARSIYSLPDSVSFKLGAYIEPIAASLAVLKTGIRPQEKGLIYGGNRFALLTQRILEARGFADVSIFDLYQKNEPLENNAYDFIIETFATTEALNEIVRAVRPLGKIILKSRQHQPVGVNLIPIIKKELTLQAVNYGSFREALDMVSSGRLDVDGLLGPIYELNEFERAFRESKQSESLKLFFSLTD